ncbi:hypothetical protein ABEB36_008543 [Hypothenemus hampei]|uniref:RAD50-interacting protein 1 n=1 Tax=Hypothenemus hampei TaxID=57062 RepID=A0ABD1EM92_HYPHA
MNNSNITTKQPILKELEDEYQDQLLDLNRCTAIYEHLLLQKQILQKESDPSNPNGLIGATINEAKSILVQSQNAISQGVELVHSIGKHLKELDEVRTSLKSKFEEVNTYETTVQYLKVIQQIEYLCSELKSEVTKKKDDEKSVTLFANLTEISRLLTDCPLVSLKCHIKETIFYWYNIIKEKLTKDFDEVLKSIKWPFLSVNINFVAPLKTNIDKLQLLTEYLLQIELPSDYVVSSDGHRGIISHFQPPCLPIELLIQPLRKRFLYHFYGNRKTNRSDRPEWYFTQVLTWIRDNQDHVSTWIQPVIEKFGLHHIDARTEFIRGLVQLAAEKLNSELPSIQYDDFTFSHSIDEALGFDKELKDIYNYPATEPSIVVVLTQASILVKWLTMEKKYALEKMDAMLSQNSLDAFDLLTSDVEDLKITTCADSFITLLQTIAERYECLPQPGHRLQFLELQLELLDDFRVRLMQIVHAEEGDYMESKVPMIANTLYYIEGVLVDWGMMLHYLNLYYYKTVTIEIQESSSPTFHSVQLKDLEENGTLTVESNSVFSETISLYKHFRNDILLGIAEAVIMEVKKKSWEYRREKWASMNVSKDFRSLSLTPSACPIFEILAKRLHQMKKKFQSNLFIIVRRNIAMEFDTYLFEDLVMDNRFNEGGALQLKFDITRNLLPLFAQYTDMSANSFIRLIESCNLLNLAKGSALLLRETLLALEEATGVEDTREKMLKEIGVNHFSPKMAVKILNQRVDITVNRLNVD